ncbi:siphovirus Gp157 family protein [Halomonas litopenaei]|uniref:siphovirus Gp157 family protein n=1 Tax=Halomonas litopenaei TaxID=2109328 RepID=UPI001A8CE64A|nr:siphovirus Gp157 family protein [Halomonas litopenaei]MBN8410728.1 siphovirus Gp157 family protein [Halomonas litopenaei]
MQTLYDLAAEHQQLVNLAADNDEDFAAALADTLDANDQQIDDKIEATVIVARQLESDAEACKAEAKRLSERAKTLERNAGACRERVMWCMENIGKKSIKRPLFTITRQAGRQIAAIDSVDDLPDDYLVTKTTTAPDKKLILERLKAGEAVPGCHLDSGKPSLRVS